MFKRFSVKVSFVVAIISLAIIFAMYILCAFATYNVLREDFYAKNINATKQSIEKLNFYVDNILKNLELTSNSDEILKALETGRFTLRATEEISALKQTNENFSGVVLISEKNAVKYYLGKHSDALTEAVIKDKAFRQSAQKSKIFVQRGELLVVSKVCSNTGKEEILGCIGAFMPVEVLPRQMYNNVGEDSSAQLYIVTDDGIYPEDESSRIIQTENYQTKIHNRNIYIKGKLCIENCFVVVKTSLRELYESVWLILKINTMVFVLFVVLLVLAIIMLKKSISKPLEELNKCISENSINEDMRNEL